MTAQTKTPKDRPKPTERPKLTLLQKMLEVRKSVPAVTIDSYNEFHKFGYVSAGAVVAAIREKMDEVGVMLLPSITGEKHVTLVKLGTKDGPVDRFLVRLDIEYEWIDVDNPTDKIVKAWMAVGLDMNVEYAFGKALTYADKYMIFKSLQIASEDDPDGNPGVKSKGDFKDRPKFDFLQEMGKLKKRMLEAEYYATLKLFKAKKSPDVAKALQEGCYKAMLDIVARNDRFRKAMLVMKKDIGNLDDNEKAFEDALKVHGIEDFKQCLDKTVQSDVYRDLEKYITGRREAKEAEGDTR